MPLFKDTCPPVHSETAVPLVWQISSLDSGNQSWKRFRKLDSIIVLRIKCRIALPTKRSLHTPHSTHPHPLRVVLPTVPPGRPPALSSDWLSGPPRQHSTPPRPTHLSYSAPARLPSHQHCPAALGAHTLASSGSCLCLLLQLCLSRHEPLNWGPWILTHS